MANIVGSLKVLLGLDAAEFTAGLSKADAQAKRFATQQSKVFAEAAVAFKAAGLAAAAAVAAMTKGAIDSADQLNKLAQKTGIATESLSGLQLAAQLSDVSTEALGAGLAKLARSMSDAAKGSNDQARAFAAIGVAVVGANGQLRSTESVLTDIASRFAGYTDGAEKAALAQALFGRAGADLIPLLNAGADGLAEMQTKAQDLGLVIGGRLAQDAERFNDTLTEVGTVSRALGLQIAQALLPGLQALADAMLEARKEGSLFSAVADALKVAFEALTVTGANVAFVLRGVGTEMGGIAAQLAALIRGDLSGFTAISDAMREDAKRARSELDAFEQRILGTGQRADSELSRLTNRAAGSGPGPGAKRPAPRIPGAASGGASSALRKQLDADLRAIREFGEQQRAAYDFANRFVDQAYEQGQISLQDDIDAKRRLREASLAATLDTLDREAAAVRAAQRSATGQARADAETRLAEVVARRAATVQQASRDEILATQEEAGAIEQLRQRYDDLRSSILEISGDTAAAVQIRIDQQVEAARKLAISAGGDTSLADQLRARLEGTEQLRQAQADYNALLEQTRDAEESILLAARESGATELDTLAQLGEARQAALQQMTEMVERAQDLARTLGTEDAVRFARELEQGLKRATAEADPLLEHMRDIGREAGQSIADGFGEAIAQGKSLRDVLTGIAQDLLRISTRKLVTEPLGDMFSGLLGNLTGSLFGGSSGGGLGITGGGGGLIDLGKGLLGAGRAVGGRVFGGGVNEVAERRPEVLDVNGRKFLLSKQGGTIDPAPQLSQRQSTVINAPITVTIPANVSEQTANQAGAAIARRMQAINRRFN